MYTSGISERLPLPRPTTTQRCASLLTGIVMVGTRRRTMLRRCGALLVLSGMACCSSARRPRWAREKTVSYVWYKMTDFLCTSFLCCCLRFQNTHHKILLHVSHISSHVAPQIIPPPLIFSRLALSWGGGMAVFRVTTKRL